MFNSERGGKPLHIRSIIGKTIDPEINVRDKYKSRDLMIKSLIFCELINNIPFRIQCV